MRHAVHDALLSLPGPREGRVPRARSLRKAFESARQAAKVERCTWHDMRHSFASWWVMRGGNLQALQASPPPTLSALPKGTFGSSRLGGFRLRAWPIQALLPYAGVPVGELSPGLGKVGNDFYEAHSLCRISHAT